MEKGKRRGGEAERVGERILYQSGENNYLNYFNIETLTLYEMFSYAIIN